MGDRLNQPICQCHSQFVYIVFVSIAQGCHLQEEFVKTRQSVRPIWLKKKNKGGKHSKRIPSSSRKGPNMLRRCKLQGRPQVC